MTFFSRLLSVLAAGSALLVAACAQVPVQSAAADKPAAERPRPQPKAHVEPLPNLELTSQILYQMLLAEIAGQRDGVKLSASAYLDLAKKTRDPRIARRAAEVALHARDLDTALQAAQLWLDADPESPLALQMLTGLLVGANRLDEIQPHIAKLLSLDSENVGGGLLGLNRLFARHPDKKAVLRLVEEITVPYVGRAEAHYARAQAALTAGAWQHGIGEIEKAIALRPDWEQAVLLKAQLQHPESADQALETLSAYLAAHPKALEVRQHYARGLVGQRKYQEARGEFQRLLEEFPDNAEVIYAVGILSTQLHDWDVAEENFKKLLERDFAEVNAVRLYLGQIAEERKRPEEALNWYAQVPPGEQYLAAQIRIAQMLGKQGKLEDARRHLHDAAASSPGERVQLLLAEAQILRDAGEARVAFDLLESSLSGLPNQPELLYESALLAEKLGRTEVLEAKLRNLIQISPEHAHAYNALGYSFAERNERLEEAKQLIAKALQLSPEDPFILDSMGWVLFRSGDNAGALTYLQRALALRQDPEIAAHLGEVLWVMGRRDEAKKTWREAERADPGNEALAEVIRRFKP